MSMHVTLPHHAIANWLIAAATLAADRAGVDAKDIHAFVDAPMEGEPRAAAGSAKAASAVLGALRQVEDVENSSDRLWLYVTSTGRDSILDFHKETAPDVLTAGSAARRMGYWPTTMHELYSVLNLSLTILAARGVADARARERYESTVIDVLALVHEVIELHGAEMADDA